MSNNIISNSPLLPDIFELRRNNGTETSLAVHLRVCQIQEGNTENNNQQTSQTSCLDCYFNYVLESYRQNKDLDLLKEYIDATELSIKEDRKFYVSIDVFIFLSNRMYLFKALHLLFLTKCEETSLVIKIVSLFMSLPKKFLCQGVLYNGETFFGIKAEILSYTFLHIQKTSSCSEFSKTWKEKWLDDDNAFDILYIKGNIAIMRLLFNNGFQPSLHRVREGENFLRNSSCPVVRDTIFSAWENYKNQRPKRAYQMLEMINLLFENSFWNDNSVQCLQMKWDTIPDAYISHGELMSIFGDSEHFRKTFTKIDNKYKQSYSFGIASIICPRTLQHLSRCAIRVALNDNFNLPLGIESLKLPLILKCYLKLE